MEESSKATYIWGAVSIFVVGVTMLTDPTQRIFIFEIFLAFSVGIIFSAIFYNPDIHWLVSKNGIRNC
jgi:hypothetical protein